MRAFVARIQSLADLRYHSPIMNMMAEDFVPIEIVGMMNVAIHGIDKTRDYLDRNLRGVLYHGAPLPDEIAAGVCRRLVLAGGAGSMTPATGPFRRVRPWRLRSVKCG